MNQSDYRELLDFSRRKILGLLDAINELPDPVAALAYRPGPGRAPLAWQLMHVAATEDRHLHVRMTGGSPREPDFVRRFAGGSVPDDDTPTVAVIRRYLEDRRRELLEHLAGLADDALDRKPNAEATWTYREWFKVLVWHETHHQGQAHLTFNLYRAQHAPSVPKVGH